MMQWILALFLLAASWPAKAQMAPLLLPFPPDPGQGAPVRVPPLPRTDSPPSSRQRSPRSQPGDAPPGHAAPCTNFIESNGKKICL